MKETKATYSFIVFAEDRDELRTEAWERAWSFFGDDQSSTDPPTLTFTRFDVDESPTIARYRANVTAEGTL